MAKFTCDFPVELETQLLALERAGQEETVKKILEAGGERVTAEMKSQCSAYRETGKMTESIRATRAKKNEKGYCVVVRPTGKETRKMKNGKTHTVRNMEKLVYLHYGTSRQRATGIVTRVANKARVPTLEAMQAVFNREVKA